VACRRRARAGGRGRPKGSPYHRVMSPPPCGARSRRALGSSPVLIFQDSSSSSAAAFFVFTAAAFRGPAPVTPRRPLRLAVVIHWQYVPRSDGSGCRGHACPYGHPGRGRRPGAGHGGGRRCGLRRSPPFKFKFSLSLRAAARLPPLPVVVELEQGPGLPCQRAASPGPVAGRRRAGGPGVAPPPTASAARSDSDGAGGDSATP
jgi:hypothetical protein